MKGWVRYLVCAIFGLLLGAGGAVWSVRAGAFGSSETIGPWTTGRDFGTNRASAYTRAVVALRGLLALPATEARYYNASVDDAGRPLDGRCTYIIKGGSLPGRWWSLTLYDHAGYLVGNSRDIHSIGSAGFLSPGQAHWMVFASPDAQTGHWLPTGRIERFELTLRAYLPDDGGKGNFTQEQLPSIVRVVCA